MGELTQADTNFLGSFLCTVCRFSRMQGMCWHAQVGTNLTAGVMHAAVSMPLVCAHR